MDRKFCVLLYSNYSKASLDLINHIKKIPLDFPTMVGLTMICIDNPDFKMILQRNKIDYVPTLLVEYYNGSKQKFQREYIYTWIDQIIASSIVTNSKEIENENQNTDQTQVTAPVSQSVAKPDRSSNEVPASVSLKANKTFISSETRPSQKKPDISSIAIEMQKNRDLELAEIKEQQKPV